MISENLQDYEFYEVCKDFFTMKEMITVQTLSIPEVLLVLFKCSQGDKMNISLPHIG